MIQLLDLTGKIVFEDVIVNKTEYILKNDNLKPGMYFIEIQGENNYKKNIGSILIYPQLKQN